MTDIATLRKTKSTLAREIELRDQKRAENLEAQRLAVFLQGVEEIKAAVKESRLSFDKVMEAISNLTIESPVIPEIKIPEIKAPKVSVPEPKVTVNVPKIDVPEAKVTVDVPPIKMPKITVPKPKIEVKPADVKFPEEMKAEVINGTQDTPFFVVVVDKDGKPVSFDQGGQILPGGGRTLAPKEKVSSAKIDTAITVGDTSTQLLAANEERHTFTIVNDSDQVVYLKYGGTAKMNSGIRLNPNGGSHTDSVYIGQVTAIAATENNKVTVLEL